MSNQFETNLETPNNVGNESNQVSGQEMEQIWPETEISRETLGETTELTSEQEVIGIFGEIDKVDQDFFGTQKSIAETKDELAKLRENMNLPPSEEEPPSVEFQNERLEELEERRSQLVEQKDEWLKRHGREKLPNGIAFELDENSREARGGSFKEQEIQEESIEISSEKKENRKGEKKDDLKMRKELLKLWEKEAVQSFEKAIRKDWRIKDAMNLELAIKLMKIRVPSAMNKKAEDYINGKVDLPPFSTVWIHWETISLFDRMTDKPNKIKKLEIAFDEEVEQIVSEEELVPIEENEENSGNNDESGTNEATV